MLCEIDIPQGGNSFIEWSAGHQKGEFLFNFMIVHFLNIT